MHTEDGAKEMQLGDAYTLVVPTYNRPEMLTALLRYFVASEIVRHPGAVICAAVSPYQATRNEGRQMIAEDQFLLIHVATPFEVCEQRDPKGMYARARRGEITGFTGIDDPYEPPAHPDLVLTTLDADECARRVLHLLEARGFARPRVLG